MRFSSIIIFLLIGFASCGQDSKKIESLYRSGELELAVEEGKKILAIDSNDLVTNHLTGRALTDLKKYEEAKSFLNKSISETSPPWMKAWSHGYLGICYYATDNYEKSKQSLEKTLELNATRNSTKFAQKRLKMFQMTEYFDDWEFIETPNIRFHIQPHHGIKKLQEYCEAREKAYGEINHFFNASPHKKIDFYVWSKPKVGKKILGRKIGFANSNHCIINSRIEQTKGHEITHILSDHSIKPKIKNRLINEGVAVAFDLTNRDRIEMAKSANEENFKVKELMEKAHDLPESLIYPIGGALIEFLRKQKTDDELKSLIRNQTWENLILIYGEDSIQDFEEMIRK